MFSKEFNGSFLYFGVERGAVKCFAAKTKQSKALGDPVRLEPNPLYKIAKVKRAL